MAGELLQQFTDIQGWIPESDIDGIDSDRRFLARALNVDFYNGYFQNAKDASLYEDIPDEINNLVTDGYEILRVIFFEHSSRGQCFFYSLYKLDSGNHLLKFFCKDDYDTYELNPDPVSSDIEYLSKPTNISFCFANDQLKVNLNILASFPTIGAATVANFTLIFEGIQKAISIGLGSQSGPDLYWYLVPRWLGWSYNSTIVDKGTDTNTLIHHNTSAGSFTSTHSEIQDTTDIIQDTSFYYSGGGSAEFVNADTQKVYEVANIDYAQGIEFYWNAYSWGAEGSALDACILEVLDSSNNSLYTQVLSSTSLFQWVKVKINFPELNADLKIRIIKPAHTGVTPLKYPHFDEMTIFYSWNIPYALLGINDDNQRFMIEQDEDGGFVFESTVFKIKHIEVDWRIKDFELYLQLEENGIYTKVANFNIGSNVNITWNAGDGTHDLDLEDLELNLDSTESLNFNYGLGATVSVLPTDREVGGTYSGDFIYSEIVYRNRTYYVRNDYRLYLSHIAGNALHQPDSFPYNTDVDFGYLKTDLPYRLHSLAITSLDEVIIHGFGANFLYIVQSTQNTVFRKIKLINGSEGITSLESLTKDLVGFPSSSFLLWHDNNGVYAYGGGINPPKDITENNMNRYWRELNSADKDNSIGFYVKNRKEYWIQVNDKIYVFEIPYGRWKEYEFSWTIKNFIGYIDNIPYILCTDNKIRKIDFNGSALPIYLETHYNSDYSVNQIGRPSGLPEVRDKILQNFYLSVKNTSVAIIEVKYNINNNIDLDNEILITRADKQIQVLQAPLLVRYGRIKLKMTCSKILTQISSFGYYFSLPSHRPISGETLEVTGIGQNVGLSFGIYQ